MITRNKSNMSKNEIEIVDISDSDSEGDGSNKTVSIHESSDESDKIVSEPTVYTNDESTKDEAPQDDGSVTLNDDSARIQDASFEDYDYNLKIMRFGNFELYKTTWQTKLSVALKDLISELAKTGKTLVLTKRDGMETLSLDATPHSLNLDSGTILNAIVISNRKPTTSTAKSAHDPNTITLKLQDGQRKHLKEFQISKQEPLRVLKEKYAEVFNIDLKRMKLSFDGDHVDDQDTPESLDIEDEFHRR